jgi:hypothetical protein
MATLFEALRHNISIQNYKMVVHHGRVVVGNLDNVRLLCFISQRPVK